MANTEKKRQTNATYRERNRAKLAAAQRARRIQLKNDVLDHYGRTCATCGYDNPLALCIDHVNDNGAEERRALGGQNFSGWRFYAVLRKRGFPDGYQTLCANCNLIKQLTRTVSSEE